MKRLLKSVVYIPKRIIMLIIRVYQRTLSPDHGWFKSIYPYGVCRYQPTCSSYTYQAIDKYGLIKGSFMGIWRILRCNPWSKGGKDPIK